jgi:hypothetical protein
MATVAEIEPTPEAIAEYLTKEWLQGMGTDSITPALITLDHVGFDKRIGWDTYYILFNGCCVGMTDGTY